MEWNFDFTLVQRLCNTVAYDYVLYQKYPAPDDRYETAVNLDLGLSVPPYKSSAFWGIMLEWMAVLEQRELYETLLPFLQENLKEVTFCTWFLRAKEEQAFYDPNVMYRAGEGVALDAKTNFEDLRADVGFLLEQFASEKFSFDTFSFLAMELIACRYYGCIPRVCIEDDGGNNG